MGPAWRPRYPLAPRPTIGSMPFALGQRLLFHQLFGRGGTVAIVAIVAVVLLLRFWPLIVARLGSWWGSR